MGHYPHDRGWSSQYSSAYHLSRKVECVDCGVRLLKNHDFVQHGSRCWSCWDEYVQLCADGSGQGGVN